MPMSELKEVKSDSIMPVIKNLIKEGKGVRITVTGNSMYPFLRDKKDSVVLYKTSMESVKIGDIILVRRQEGDYVLHRVIRKGKQALYLLGDAQKSKEGPIYSSQILAKAEVIYRGERELAVDGWFIRILSLLWTLVIPFRKIIMKGYHKVRNCRLAVLK